MAPTTKRKRDLNSPKPNGSGQALNKSNRKYEEKTKASTKKNASELEKIRARIKKRDSKK